MRLEVRGVTTLLEVFDMPRSIAFYRDTLGFEVDGAELMLNTAYDDDQRPPGPESARVAAHADTGLFFACPDPEAAYTHLRGRGVTAERPRGFRLRFQWPAS